MLVNLNQIDDQYRLVMTLIRFNLVSNTTTAAQIRWNLIIHTVGMLVLINWLRCDSIIYQNSHVGETTSGSIVGPIASSYLSSRMGITIWDCWGPLRWWMDDTVMTFDLSGVDGVFFLQWWHVSNFPQQDRFSPLPWSLIASGGWASHQFEYVCLFICHFLVLVRGLCKRSLCSLCMVKSFGVLSF